MAKSLHPTPPKPPGKTIAFRSLGFVLVTVFTLVVLGQVDTIKPDWVKWSAIILISIGGWTLTRPFEPPPQPAWVEGPDLSQTVVSASYWPGYVLATPEAVRAALLTAIRSWGSSAMVRRPAGSLLEVENYEEGWRIVIWQEGTDDELVGVRADGQAIPDPPRGLKKYLVEKGGFFSFDEASAVLISFAETGSAGHLVQWRLRSEI